MRTELHFHLLPGVDDGPPDDAAAVQLARAAVSDGTGRVVATPHVRMVKIRELPDRVQRLRTLLTAEEVPLEVRCGGELAPGDVGGLEDSALELIAHGPRDRRWVLVEAPLVPSRPDLVTAAADLRDRGFDVLVGHPERSPAVTRDELERLVDAGALLQLNASSLLGRHGSRATQRALELAHSGLPFVLASDAHSLSRPPLLGEATRALEGAGVAPEVVRYAAERGPEQLLRDGLRAYTPALASSSAASERRSSRETCICE